MLFFGSFVQYVSTMKKPLATIFLALLCTGVFGQRGAQYLQTNLFAPISRLPSVNLGYVRYSADTSGFLELGLNVFFGRRQQINNPDWRLNWYSVEKMIFPSTMATIGYKWQEKGTKKYVGLDFLYGLFMFKNQQLVATKIVDNNGFLRVVAYDNHSFNSYNNMLGGTVGFGRILNFENGTALDFNVKLGAFFMVRMAGGRKENIAPSAYRKDIELPEGWEHEHWLSGNVANLEGNANYGFIFRIGLNYRFLKF